MSTPASMPSELIRLASRTNSDRDRLELDRAPTQAEFAVLIGATREAVARHLNAMKNEGLIEMTRSKITIVSLRALKARDEETLGKRFSRAPVPEQLPPP